MERWPADLGRMLDVFGAPPSALAQRNIQRLIDEEIRESDDLDFKKTSYFHDAKAAREKGKVDLAVDVTALANDRGGVIVLGVDELQEVADELHPVSLEAQRLRWLREVIATYTQPHVDVHIVAVASDAQPTEGWIVIAVPPGTRRPYAMTKGDEYLRFPRRHGTTTRNLREAEIADLYRARFAGRSDADDRGRALLDDPSRRLDLRDSALLSLALVPNLRAPSAPLDADARDRVETRLSQGAYAGPPRLWTGFFWQRPHVYVGHRRILAANQRPNEDRAIRGPYAELHADGAGFTCYPLEDIGRVVHPPRQLVTLEPSDISFSTARSLRVLADHARDDAGVTGEATVYAKLTANKNYTVGFLDQNNFPATDDTTPVATDDTEIDVTVPIDDMARSDTGLLAAASLITGDLLQSFAIPEDRVLTRAGALRHRWVPALVRRTVSDLEEFARERGVMLDESDAARR